MADISNLKLGKDLKKLPQSEQRRILSLFSGLKEKQLRQVLTGKAGTIGKNDLQTLMGRGKKFISSGNQSWLKSLYPKLGERAEIAVGDIPAQTRKTIKWGKRLSKRFEGKDSQKLSKIFKGLDPKGWKSIMRGKGGTFGFQDLDALIGSGLVEGGNLSFLRQLRGGKRDRPGGPQGPGGPRGPEERGGTTIPTGVPEGFGPHPGLKDWVDKFESTQIPDQFSFPVPPPHLQLPYQPGPGRAQGFMPFDPPDWNPDPLIQGGPQPFPMPPMGFLPEPPLEYTVDPQVFPEVDPLLGNYPGFSGGPGVGGGAGSGGGQDLPPRDDEGEIAK